MNAKNFTEYNLPLNAYVTFDATTLKDLIINRLNESEVFKDQVYEGSNINAFIDVVAYMYHVLLFYLNNTSSESTFTTATLYENMNKLVSNLGYKPTGKQTSMGVLSLSGGTTLPTGVLTLKRFSTLFANGQPFTITRDISFDKPQAGAVEKVYPDNSFIYQGSITEHPQYTATGEEFEIVTIVDSSPIDNSQTFIADNTFSIFVYDNTNRIWSEWQETSSLFLEDSVAKKYEKKLNENGNYEFKFGNNINGLKLRAGDLIQIYYVVSNGTNGVVGPNVLFGNQFTLYNSPAFTGISNNIYDTDFNFITPSLLPSVIVTNPNASTPIGEGETVEEIRKNAPKFFASQNRLVTRDDYTNFIDKNYNLVVKSVKVLDNTTYTSRFLKYFYTIGLNKPNDDTRVLFNQVAFSNSTSFNNVYLFCVPKNATIINETLPNYLNFAQKQVIINACNNSKDITHNVVCVDPIYKAFDIGLRLSGEDNCIDFRDSTALVIKKFSNSNISDYKIIDRVSKVITDYFNNIELGQVINLGDLSNNIKNLDGVKDVLTRRTDTNYEVPKINVVAWNPIYEEDDVVYTSQNYTLEDFQYAFFYEISNLKQKIIVENE
jgi:hypothetical protein